MSLCHRHHQRLVSTRGRGPGETARLGVRGPMVPVLPLHGVHSQVEQARDTCVTLPTKD